MKAAVIGMGPHGLRVAQAIQRIPALELAAVVDRQTDVLERLDLPETVRRCTSLEEMTAVGDIQLVSVATNGPSHAALSLAAIQAGARRVMVEKPMACSLAECDQILEAARQTGTRVAVDHVRRYSQIYLWLRDQIASGVWGEVRAIWMQRPGIGLGCNATHSFDAVTMLAGRPVKHVTAWVDPPKTKNPRGEQFVDPGGLVIMDLGDNVRATVAQIEDGAGPTSLEIDLTAARVRMDERSGEVEIVERDLSVKPGPGRPPVLNYVKPPENISTKLDLVEMIRGCLEDLAGDGAIYSDGVSGRSSVEVLVAAYLSHRRGNLPVALPLVDSEALELWLPVT